MAVCNSVACGKSVVVDLLFVKNVTDGPQKLRGIAHLYAKIRATSLLGLSSLDTARNLRNALFGPDTARVSDVVRDITNTIEEEPDAFSSLNSGLVIGARSSEIVPESRNRKLLLENPSVLNGAQTVGALERAVAQGVDVSGIFVAVEFIITADTDFETEVTIARNFQHKVKPYSIYSRQGGFNELYNELVKAGMEECFAFDESEERKVENRTQISHLVRLLFMAAPIDYLDAADLGIKTQRSLATSVAPALKAWCILSLGGDDITPATAKARKVLYQMLMDIAPTIWLIHTEWRCDRELSWKFKNLDRANGTVRNPEGMFFAAYSFIGHYIEKVGRKWVINDDWRDYVELIRDTLRTHYRDRNASNASAMARDASCYEAMHTLHKHMTFKKS